MSKEKIIFLIKNIQIINYKEKHVLNHVSNLLKNFINELTIDDIYLVLHTFCKLNFTKDSLYNSFVKIIMNKKPSMNTRILTQLLIDLHKTASLDINMLTFFTEYYIKGALNKFSLFDLSMILFIYNKYNYNDSETVGQICQVLNSCFMPLIDQDKGVLTTILLSLSMLNLNYGMYFNLIKEHVYNNYEQFEIKYLCNISYSIALWIATNSLRDEVLNDVLKNIVSLLLSNISKLKNEELKQVHIVLYLLKNMGENCQDAIKKIEKKNIRNIITVSKIQQQVDKIFKEIGLRAERELPVGPYMLDFAIKKKRICIEINGFMHYYTFGGKINAKSSLKYYILNKLNWKVITIEYMDWKNKSKEDKIKYLETNILHEIK
ncbi:RAP protein, putative [Plasmodium malariae]|uniref:RAP protein, putative n=1 Tax=Plasmodium malariae TaxID=5858 RepID=A0A1C3KDW5_PLAMA|nr:RAP protein, putative [Plasmodium malariae]